MTGLRIKRSRARGWRMPANTVYVGRPSRYANSATVWEFGREQSVALFERKIDQFKRLHPQLFKLWIAPLVGKKTWLAGVLWTSSVTRMCF